MEVITGDLQVYRLCPEFLGPAFVGSQFHLRGPGWNCECWGHILDFLAASKDLSSIYYYYWVSDFPFPTPMPREVNSAVINFLKVRLMKMETLSHCPTRCFLRKELYFQSSKEMMGNLKKEKGWWVFVEPRN